MAMQPTAVRVGVLGAGQMGAGIAAALLRSGMATTLVDVNAQVLESGLARALQLAPGRGKPRGTRPQDPAGDAENLRIGALLSSSSSPAALAGCQVVIEAVTENEAIKTSLFRQLAGILHDEAVLASNTSTIPISRMARAYVHPDRFAGMHFFHPAQRMELVEVIRGDQTTDATVHRLVELARALGKRPIVVRDCPGFLVTRVLYPYLNQALGLLREGTEMDAIDAAAVAFGMPTGPIALLDFIGLDTVQAIFRIMAEGYPDRASTCPLLDELVRLGRLGQKSGAGLRRYDGIGARPVPGPDPEFAAILARHRRPHPGHEASPDAPTITDRLFLPMLLEAVRAVDEGIARSPADVDTGVVLGLGFPAGRGGLFGWCRSQGEPTIVQKMTRYAALGSAFHGPASWTRLAGIGNGGSAPED